MISKCDDFDTKTKTHYVKFKNSSTGESVVPNRRESDEATSDSFPKVEKLEEQIFLETTV